jgi:hypothetical protein
MERAKLYSEGVGLLTKDVAEAQIDCHYEAWAEPAAQAAVEAEVFAALPAMAAEANRHVRQGKTEGQVGYSWSILQWAKCGMIGWSWSLT